MNNTIKRIFLVSLLLPALSACNKDKIEVNADHLYNDFDCVVVEKKQDDENPKSYVKLSIKNIGTKYIIPHATYFSSYKYKGTEISERYPEICDDEEISFHFFQHCCIEPNTVFNLICYDIIPDSNYLDHLKIFAIDPSQDCEKIIIDRVDEETISGLYNKRTKEKITLNNPFYDSGVDYDCGVLVKYEYRERQFCAYENVRMPSSKEKVEFKLSSSYNLSNNHDLFIQNTWLFEKKEVEKGFSFFCHQMKMPKIIILYLVAISLVN